MRRVNNGVTPVQNPQTRIESFLTLLDGDVLSLDELRSACLTGCPDTGGIRSMCWKLLLSYLPKVKCDRTKHLGFSRGQYNSFVFEFISQSNCAEKESDHPLNVAPQSNWTAYFKDNEMLSQLNKDCLRLCPDFEFFRRPTEFPSLVVFGSASPLESLRQRVQVSYLNSRAVDHNLVGVTNMVQMSQFNPFHRTTSSISSGLNGQSQSTTDLQPSPTTAVKNSSTAELHWEVIQRILFIYHKTHSGIGYAQGMSDIVAPLYFVFANDPSGSWRANAEADTFFCFCNLMTEIHLNFSLRRGGEQLVGIGGLLLRYANLLEYFDRSLSQHLNRLGLEPAHYAFRWLSLLLAREFSLPDLLRLWDSLFADKHRFSMMLYVCCAMLMLIRKQLIAADFPTALHLLQHYPTDIPVATILSKAMHLSAQDQNQSAIIA